MLRRSSWDRSALCTSLLCIAALIVLGAGEAAARSSENTALPSGPMASSDPGSRAIAQWQEKNSWRYGTDHFFALSKSLRDEQLPDAVRKALYCVSLPFDVALLPTAALAGLWGD